MKRTDALADAMDFIGSNIDGADENVVEHYSEVMGVLDNIRQSIIKQESRAMVKRTLKKIEEEKNG